MVQITVRALVLCLLFFVFVFIWYLCRMNLISCNVVLAVATSTSGSVAKLSLRVSFYVTALALDAPVRLAGRLLGSHAVYASGAQTKSPTSHHVNEMIPRRCNECLPDTNRQSFPHATVTYLILLSLFVFSS